VRRGLTSTDEREFLADQAYRLKIPISGADALIRYELFIASRQAEQAILQTALLSNEPEMVAVIGRRRVGKTFLVRSIYSGKINFEITGIQNGSSREQLQHFTDRLNYYAQPLLPFQAPKNWQHAFQMLIIFLEKGMNGKKFVVFLDEFPWLAGRNSDFLKAFGSFWNSWASQNNIVIVICGSAASWMIANVAAAQLTTYISFCPCRPHIFQYCQRRRTIRRGFRLSGLRIIYIWRRWVITPLFSLFNPEIIESIA